MSRDLAGESDRLKGFAIALDVFDRAEDFDASTASVVRVQAGRLRELLDTYYAGEGAHDPVRIDVPRGGYVPSYKYTGAKRPQTAEEPTEPHSPAAAAEVQRSREPADAVPPANHEHLVQIIRNIRYSWFGLAAVFALMIGMIVQSMIFRPGDPDHTHPHDETQVALFDGVPASRFMPWVMVTADDDEIDITQIEDAVGRFETIEIIHGEDVADHAETPGFLLNVVMRDGDTVLRFVDAETGVLVTTGTVTADTSEPDFATQLSGQLMKILPSSGALYGHLISEANLNPLTNCVVSTRAYLSRPTEARHLRAIRCHERLIEGGLESSLSHASIGILTVHKLREGYAYPADATPRDALAAARVSIELDPGSSVGHLAMAMAFDASGEQSVALGQFAEAHALNPFDLTIAGVYGVSLNRAGRFADAYLLLDRAVRALPAHRPWLDHAYFVAAFQTGRTDSFGRAAAALAGYEEPEFIAARLIAADVDGNEKRRTALARSLNSNEHTDFMSNAYEFYQRSMPPEAAAKLAEALKSAAI
ncbi:tetratricopeptide repeat protein [Oricola sp.]|uniref:tetratricopeptide repeat protein n=1 Tax=Oricola sp. TaxID=1979950 RepID=UPI003BAC5D0A